MARNLLSHCDSCGLAVNLQVGENCPRCGYPVSQPKEERFLEAAIRDLQRVATYGGANLTVTDLIYRYQSRLKHLQDIRNKAALAPVDLHTSSVETKPIKTPLIDPFASSVQQSAAGPAAPQPAQEVTHSVFSWRSFFADQAINIVASLGAFLILIGSLSFVVTTSNPWISFLALFIVQAVFGSIGIVTYRFPSFRIVAFIYTIIFALLVPLVGISAYQLAAGDLVPLGVPTLVAVAAIYAAIVYILLALYQRVAAFAYPGMASLLLADLAIARAFNLSYWWWPVTLILLAFPALISIQRLSGSARPFTGNRVVLSTPIRVFMYAIVAISALGLAYTTVYSILVSNPGNQAAEVRYSILVMTLLLLLWVSLALWLTRLSKWALIVAYLFLASVLAFCYALDLQAIGYVLALTGVALFYHGLNRLAGRLLQPFGVLSLGLDQITIALAFVVPFVGSSLLPFQLLFKAYAVAFEANSPLLFRTNWQTVAQLAAIACMLLLTVSITLNRAGLQKVPAKGGWRWLLLLSGFLLNWEYSLVVLMLHVVPAWYFLGLTLVLITSAVFVRQRIGDAWANPLDVVALADIFFTLILALNLTEDAIIALLLFFAALAYGIVVYQRRPAWLFLPLIFALLALLPLLDRPIVMLVMAVLLPPVSVVIRRFISANRRVPIADQPAKLQLSPLWEWPLIAAALFYGVIFFIHDVTLDSSTVQTLSGIIFPIALELTLISLSWFVSAVASRRKVWLLPATGFAVGALLIPTNSFWALTVLTPVAALLAVGVHRFAGRDWALPLSIVAVLAAVMTGYTGTIQHHQQVLPWVLLGYTGLALIIMLLERAPEMLVFPLALAAWTIAEWQPPLQIVPLMIAYSLLCVLIFASQYIWRALPPATRRVPAPTLHTVLGIGGQVTVVIYIIARGGLFASSGLLAHAGAGALAVLAILLFWSGRVYSTDVMHLVAAESDAGKRNQLERRARKVLHWCNYAAGLLLALVVSWELSAFDQTRLDLLSLTPASYLSIVAPFMMRDEVLPQRHRVGQVVSIFGAALLLLPTLWLSLNDSNLLSTLILLSEAIALLCLGIVTRVRNQARPGSSNLDNATSSILVYASVSMIITGAMRALFLSGQGVPVVLTSGGLILVAFATALKLVSARFLSTSNH